MTTEISSTIDQAAQDLAEASSELQRSREEFTFAKGALADLQAERHPPTLSSAKFITAKREAEDGLVEIAQQLEELDLREL